MRRTRPRFRVFVSVVGLVACVAGCSTPPADPSSRTQGEVKLAKSAEEVCETRGWPAGLPIHSFSTDGCSAWPDKGIYDCCVEHDVIYWCGGTAKMRLEADRRLAECAEAKDYLLHDFVYFGVHLGGAPWLPTPWRWGYGHAYGTGYTDPRALGD